MKQSMSWLKTFIPTKKKKKEKPKIPPALNLLVPAKNLLLPKLASPRKQSRLSGRPFDVTLESTLVKAPRIS